MILQSDTRLDGAIRQNGCYFMAILFLAGQKTGKSFGPKDVLRLKEQAISLGYLGENCYVRDPDGIFKLAGLTVQYTNRHEKAGRKARWDEIEILYYRWDTFGHFVAGASGVVSYDPLGVSNAVKLGTLRSKRIFKLV